MRAYSPRRRGESYEGYRDRLVRLGEIEPGEALPVQARAAAGGRARQPAGSGTPRKRSVAATAVAAVVVLAAAVTGGVLLFGGHSGPAPHYRAMVTGLHVLDPATLDVTVRVTNTGKAAGKPDCIVSAQNAGGAYHGVNEGTAKASLAPGAAVTLAMPVTITGQGAEFATQAKATCS
jgi:hypothetical protein